MDFYVKCPACGELIRDFKLFESDDNPDEAICKCGAKMSCQKRRQVYLRGPDVVWDGKKWVELTDESGKPCSMDGEIGEPVVFTPHGYKEKA